MDRTTQIQAELGRNAADLGGLGGGAAPVGEENKAPIVAQALRPQIRVEETDGGVDQGRSMLQGAEQPADLVASKTPGRSPVQPSLRPSAAQAVQAIQNDALMNAMAAEENKNASGQEGFDPALTQDVGEAIPDMTPMTTMQLRRQLFNLQAQVDRAVEIKEPPSWPEIVRSWRRLKIPKPAPAIMTETPEQAIARRVQLTVDPEGKMAKNTATEDIKQADLRARWMAAQPSVSRSNIALLPTAIAALGQPGLLGTSYGVSTGAIVPPLLALLGTYSLYASRQTEGQEGKLPYDPDEPDYQPFGGEEQPRDAGDLEAGPREDGAMWDPQGEVPGGFWGRVLRAARSVGAVVAGLGAAAIGQSPSGEDAIGDTQGPTGEPRPDTKGPTEEPRPDTSETTTSTTLPAAGAPTLHAKFREEAIVSHPGPEPHRPTQLRPTFKQAGTDLLEFSPQAIEKSSQAFNAFDKVVGWVGDMPDVQREHLAMRYTDTLPLPSVSQLSRRDLIELVLSLQHRNRMRPGKLSLYGDPRGMGMTVDTSSRPFTDTRNPGDDQMEFPFQVTDGVHGEPPIEMPPPVDNKMLPITDIQSTQPVKMNAGYQQWYVGNTVVNPAEGTQRSRHPARAKNSSTGIYNEAMYFQGGRSQALPVWPIPGSEKSRPLPQPFQSSNRTTHIIQRTNFPETSYNKSMSYQTGIGNPFKPLPFI
jgi:hypothetical protein